MRLRLKPQRLAELVAASALSQNHLALKIGLSRGHWSEIVNGKHLYPSAKTRVRILEAFGVPLDDLFEIEAGASPWGDTDFRRAISDRYIIDGEIGQGGMGAVYLARDVRHGRSVAIKVISAEIVSGVGLDQFHREISTVAKLTHPNILPLFDSGDAAGQPFFAMPWIRGGSLRARIRERGRLGVDEVVQLTNGIAKALHYAHGERVLHCDIKPENVVLFDDHPFVMDFGIARKLHSEVGHWALRNELDVSAGTPAYVSPEQASGQADLDARSDVYSLACMVFEMLAGRPPFEGTNTQAVVSRRFIVPPPLLREFAPEVPAGVQSVLERAMSLPREQRQPTVAAFADELRAAAAGSSRVLAAVSLGASRAIGAVRQGLHLRPEHRFGAAMIDTGKDVALAWRGLRRAPGFALTVVLTLGFALGANATTFGIVDRLLLRAPPHIEAPDQVAQVRVARWFNGALGSRARSLSYSAFTDVRDRTTSFSHVAAMDQGTVSYGVGVDARPLDAMLVTGQYFRLLGTQPVAGRFVAEEDDRFPSGTPVVVLSHRLWQSSFGGRSSAVGETMHLNGSAYDIIGVAPRDFTGTGLESVDIWIPMTSGLHLTGRAGTEWASSRGWQFLEVFGRIKDGVTRDAAAQDVARAYHAGHEKWLEYESRAVASLGALVAARDADSGRAEPRVAKWLFGMALVVLVIACANIANLMLARGVARRAEFAVRRALGVSRSRLARQLLVESLLLAALGSMVGLAVARWGGGLARALLLPGVTWDASPVSGRVLLLTLAATLTAAVTAGLLPLWTSTRTDLADTLRGSSRGVAGGSRRALTALLLVQTTLATTLLIGAGLFVRSLSRVRGLDLGFSPTELLYVQVNLPGTSEADAKQWYRRAVDHLRTVPGIRGAGTVAGAPFMGNYSASVRTPGVDSFPHFAGGGPYVFEASGGTLDAMQMRLLKGRLLNSDDDRPIVPLAVNVTQRMADRLWPGKDPLSQCLIMLDGERRERPCAQVVGVVADLHRQGLNEAPFLAFFIPMSLGDSGAVPDVMVVRVAGDPRHSVELVRKEILALRPDLPYVTIAPYHDLIDPRARSWQLGATMFSVFGLLSLLMAAVGVYGVLSYTVSTRTRELGVRAALGATPLGITWTVMVNGLVVSVLGVVLGATLALAASARIEELLFDTSARDPLVFVSAGAVILAITLVATLLPGRRAGRADPLVALRAE